MDIYTVTVVACEDNEEMIFLAARTREELSTKLGDYLSTWQEGEQVPDHEFEDMYNLVYRDTEL